MPAQKRPPPPPSPSPSPSPLDNHHEVLPPEGPDGDSRGGGGEAGAGDSPPPASSSAQQQQQWRRRQEEEEEEEEEEKPQQQEQEGGGEDEKEIPPLQEDQKDDSEGDDDDGGSPSSSGAAAEDKSEYVYVKLADIRREVQCPICLGIIRKTRTVMECLHRFCRECIDKSMRLGNNECPACRTHCASRRSLRDDPNYDALIAAIYPDIDKYEEEELAFHEEDKLRNKKIQASIAETYQRQSEALGKRRSSAKATAAAFLRRSQGNFRNSHGHNSYPRSRTRGSRDTALAPSDEDDEDANGNDGGKDSSSADESSPDVVRQKRRRRWGAPRFSPAPMPSNIDECYDEHEDLEIGREPLGASPGRVGNREVLVWGKNGARSQTRHGSSGGSVGKNAKGSRITRLVEYLRNLDENDNEFDIHLTLLPLDEQNLPSLQQPYLCCRPTLLIRHLCQFIAHQIPVEAEEVEILARKKPEGGTSILKAATLAGDEISQDHAEDCKELQILEAQESLAGLHDYFSWSRGNLVLVYRSKSQHKGT